MNENCLSGVACPECGNEGPFLISVTTMALVSDDGIEEFPCDKDWDSDSACCCLDCNYSNPLNYFMKGD